MACQTLLIHADRLVPELCEPIISSGKVQGLVSEQGRVQIDVRALHVLSEVNERVDGPAGHRVFRVVASADSKHAKDGARLAHLKAVFFPDGHGAKRESSCSFLLSELLHAEAVVFVLEVSMGEHKAD